MKSIKSKLLLLFFLLLLSASVVFFKFNLIPQSLTFDEVEFAKLALTLDGKPYIPYSEMATGHSTLYFYSLLASFKIFGVNNFALRLPAALFGVAGSLMFYLVVRKIFSKNYFLAFMLAVAFTASRWYFNFARFSFEATFLLFLELASLYFFLRFMGNQSKEGGLHINLLMSGLFAGLAFNSYTPGRFFFAVPLFIIFIMFLKKRGQLIKYLLTFLIPFVIVIVPLTTYLLTHQDNRVDKLFFWKNHEMTLGEKVAGTIKNVGTVSAMFVFKGDMSGKHNYPGKPALNPIMGLLFVSGVTVALKNLKNNFNRIFISYLFISLLPSLMIYPWENPNMLRTFTAIPAVVYFSGLALNSAASRLKKPVFATALIALLIIISSAYELHTYFNYQSLVFPSAFETKPTLEEALKHVNFKY